MKQITLRMSGTGEDSIPYATYMTATGKKEISTLKDVKERLGLTERMRRMTIQRIGAHICAGAY